MKYYYCDSWRVLIVDENNDAVTFSIGEGDYARGFCDGLEQVGFVKAGADFFDAHTKLLTSQRDKEDAYTIRFWKSTTTSSITRLLATVSALRIWGLSLKILWERVS